MAEIKIKTTKARKLAYLEHVGDYGNIPYETYINQLYAWAKENKVRPGFKPIGIFHDSPEETPPEQCRSEIGIPIKGEAKPEGEVKIKDLPSMEVAVIKHKGPTKDYQNTYKKISEWITQNDYEWAGSAMEVYTKKPRTVGDETFVYANVQVPVKKRAHLLRKVADEGE